MTLNRRAFVAGLGASALAAALPAAAAADLPWSPPDFTVTFGSETGRWTFSGMRVTDVVHRLYHDGTPPQAEVRIANDAGTNGTFTVEGTACDEWEAHRRNGASFTFEIGPPTPV